MGWEDTATGRLKANIKKIKAGRYYQRLIDLGVTPDNKTEWKRAHEKLRLQDRLATRTQEERDILNAKRKALYYKHIDRERARHKGRKREERKERGEEINANQRKYYATQREENARRQCARRHVREPHRAVRAVTKLFCEGLLTYEQYNQRIAECVSRAQQISNPESSGSGGGQKGNGPS